MYSMLPFNIQRSVLKVKSWTALVAVLVNCTGKVRSREVLYEMKMTSCNVRTSAPKVLGTSRFSSDNVPRQRSDRLPGQCA